MSSVSYLFIVSVFGVGFSVVVLSLQYKHLLGVLLSLELMMLSLFLMIVSVGSGFNFEGQLCLILITLSACEASLGLAVLVSLIRTHGNDYVHSFNGYKC
uniref:NADH-ubiquinone oxidoreductase chain 4L n=4 Tax=Haliotis tuberculata TaxID=36103 RepID=D2DMM4_HALTU|nr:NADH dehydrogenase subunit 4L [Haliotis tuberculata tuberculata]ACL81491.1 NADH dehydrogenase subunit 4L [Haliotis tuberculata tuberculata]ACL99781.1 NADH dehydrogenase subunit 4L [Haliotis tuberculata coccinea]ACL99794.1 NADH dehydrogenase subunit 4L [Haliotis tuberculata ssp. AVW-2009]ACL99807.1 NADH dehydrogenase subunit 4L [Haliotis tuberculata]